MVDAFEAIVKGYLVYGAFCLFWSAFGYYCHNTLTTAVFLIAVIVSFILAGNKRKAANQKQ